MRVLFVAEDCPFPPDNGGRLRTFSLLKHLSAVHEINLISPGLADSGLESALGGRLRQATFVPPVRGGALHMVGSALSCLPHAVRKCSSRAMTAAVRSELSRGCFDLLHCDSILVSPCVPVNAGLPKLVAAHNVESTVWERYLVRERRPWMIPLLRSQLRKMVAIESKLPRVFDACAVVSERDQRSMRSRYGFRNVHVVANGVDLSLHVPLPDPLAPVLIFIGSLDYRPNKDAIQWFVESIWPRVRAELPEADMLLVGRRPPPWFPEMCAHSGVSLHGDVPDTRPHLARASLAVVPIRVGGGTRLKILEAMAAERCVLSTTIGAEGLDVRHGEHLVIADDAAQFASKAVSLLRDPGRRQSIAKAGRLLVEATYGWDQAALQMDAVWNQVGRQ